MANSDGCVLFQHDDLVNTVWYRKTLIRKSGANVGKEYFKYVSKCGRSFNSLKSAKEFDSSLQNNDDTSGVDDDDDDAGAP